MKYAYIIGSNAFVVPAKVVNYVDGDEEKEFLKINSVYHDLTPPAQEPTLNVDLHIADTNGTPLVMQGNVLADGAAYTVKKERDSVKILRGDGSTVIHVHQLDDHSAMSLEHNIIAELEVNMPVAAIRITGDFMTGSLHIGAENEKLFINKNGYANSVLGGTNQLKFTASGVVVR